MGLGEPTWEVAAERFLREKRRDGCSPATLDTYRHELLGRRTTAWRQRIDLHRPSQLGKSALVDFENELGETLSAGSVHCFHRVTRTFVRWYAEEYGGVDSAVALLRAPKLAEQVTPVITIEQETTLMAAARCDRDRFLIRFLIGTGLRLSEAVGVRLDDISEGADGPAVLVRRGKGGKVRYVPLDTKRNRLSRELRQYVRTIRAPHGTERDELFLTTRRDSGTGDYRPLDGQSVIVLLRRLAKDTGIEHCHAHAFRHTWATRAHDAGVDLIDLKRAGGWSDLKMVERYAKASSSGLAKAWQRRED